MKREDKGRAGEQQDKENSYPPLSASQRKNEKELINACGSLSGNGGF